MPEVQKLKKKQNGNGNVEKTTCSKNKVKMRRSKFLQNLHCAKTYETKKKCSTCANASKLEGNFFQCKRNVLYQYMLY